MERRSSLGAENPDLRIYATFGDDFVKPAPNMKVALSTFLLFLSISAVGQKVFPDDYRKGGIDIHSQMGEMSLQSLGGATFDNADLKDKVTLINYWFVGCRGCRQEEGFLKEVRQHFSTNERVQFVSITPSDAASIKTYLEKYGDFGFPIYPVDGFKAVKRQFSVKTFPHHQIVVDGTVVENLQVPIAQADMKAWLINRIEEALRKLGE